MCVCVEYKVAKGQVLNSADLKDIIDGLRSNNLLNYSHVLTGITLVVHNIGRPLRTINYLDLQSVSMTYADEVRRPVKFHVISTKYLTSKLGY